MSKTMQDKETKGLVKTFVNRVWKENDDNLSYTISGNGVISSTEKLEFTKKELMKFSEILAEEVEQEAERRGFERGVKGVWDMIPEKRRIASILSKSITPVERSTEMTKFIGRLEGLSKLKQ